MVGLQALKHRVAWWQWVLVSLAASLLGGAVTLIAMVALALNGVDVLDYVFLSRPPFVKNGTVAAWIALILVTQTLAPVLAFLFFRPARTLVLAGFARAADGPGLLLRLALGVCAMVALQFGWSLVDLEPAEHWRVVEHLVYAVAGGGRLSAILWLVLAIGVVIPVAEEVLFRGVLFRTVRSRWGFWVGALLSAGLFGISHGLVNAVPTALLGLYFAYQAERDGTLLGAIALHMLTNLFALVALAASL